MKKFKVQPQSVLASKGINDLLWIVTIMGDDGDAETGPHPYFDEVLVKAPTATKACELVYEADYVDEGEGCEARKATATEVKLWIDEGFKPLEDTDIKEIVQDEKI